MGLACKIAGHKWNGCTCTRCGERRNEGHDWQLLVKTTYPRACKLKCSICGKEQPTEHDWNGCICTRCGVTRSEGHILSAWQSDGQETHSRRCTVCGGARESQPHQFENISGCRRKCRVCGYQMPWHEWRDGTCMHCGKSANDYYAKKILFGEMKYSESDGTGRRAIDYVTKAADLAKIATATRKDITDSARMACARKLGDIAKKGGEDATVANRTLRDLVLQQKLGWNTLTVAGYITDPSMAKDPRIVKIVKDMQKASDDYDRAMIASDSGW
ncbi:MAG: hypothetical protein IJG53_06240 [Eggerthellaceae bacterium]|nr:hypothetical protein [Eggerthellaceae bacterium]